MGGIILVSLLVPAALVALLVYLVVRVRNLSDEVRELRRRVQALSPAPDPPSRQHVPATAPRPAPDPLPAEAELSLVDAAPADANGDTGRQRPATAPRTEWESFIGARLLNRVGAVALIIGVGFFLKYAFDRNWVPEEVRVLAGIAAGAVCIVAARRSNDRGFVVFAQGLVGAGIAILYLSVYASFNYYALVPRWAAYLLMSGVTATALWQGLSYQSAIIGLLGWLGGYTTPLMLSPADMEAAGLLTYTALLSVALLALVVARPGWPALHVLTLGGTWVTYIVWHVRAYDPAEWALPLFFVVLFGAMFIAADAIRNRLAAAMLPAHVVIAAANAVFAASMLYAILAARPDDALGISYAAMSIVCAAAYAWTPLPASGRYALTISSLAAAWAVLAVMAVWDGFERIIGWSLLSGAVLGVARWRSLHQLATAASWFTGLVLLALLTTRHAIAYAGPVGSFTPVLNERFAGFAVFSAVAMFMAFRKHADTMARRDRSVLLASSVIALFVVGSAEFHDTLRMLREGLEGSDMTHRVYQNLLMLALAWVLLGCAASVIGLRRSLPAVWVPGVVLLATGALTLFGRGMLYDPPSHYAFLVNVRSLVLCAAAASLVWAGGAISRTPAQPRVRGRMAAAMLFASLALIFTLITGETLDPFRAAMRDAQLAIPDAADRTVELARLSDTQQLSLSGAWLVYSVALLAAGFARSHRGLRLTAIGLFGLSILKIFLYDLSFLDTLYRIFSFIGLGVILLGVSYAYQRYKHLLLAADDPSFPQESTS